MYEALEFLSHHLENVVKYDAQGRPSIFVSFPKCLSSDLHSSLPGHTFPAFVVGDNVLDRVLIAKYKVSELETNGALYSLPGRDPRTSLGADQFLSRMRAAGPGISGLTAAEHGLILLTALKYGWQPKGNNNYGADYRDGTKWAVGQTITTGNTRVFKGVIYTATGNHTTALENKPDITPSLWTKGDRVGGIPSPATVSDTEPNGTRTLTGSGPLSWNHDGTPSGIVDVIGDVWEQVYGYRVFGGELQILANNDAADPSADLSAASPLWKAIMPSTTDDTYTLVAPGTDGTLKWDMIDDKPVLSNTITNRPGTYKANTFTALTTNLPHVPCIVRELGIFPCTGDTTTQGTVYYNNTADTEFFPRRAAGYGHTSYSGLGYLNVVNARGHSNGYFGGRSACIEQED